MRWSLALIAAPVALVTVPAAPPVDVKEWPVEWGGRPRDPHVAPNGKVWFVGQAGNYIANLDPASGKFTRFEIDDGVHPHNLIVDSDGMVWYAGNRAAHVGKLDPATGKVTKYPTGDPAARDPHTMVFDGKGNIWFTLQGANMIGRLVKASGDVRLWTVPTGGARPYGIKVDASGRPWVVLVGTHKIATIDPQRMKLEEIALPDEGTRPRRVEISSDGAIWYVDFNEGEIGRYNPETGETQEWMSPFGESAALYGTAMDAQDRFWFVAGGPEPAMFGGFDTKTKTFIEGTPIPSGGGTVRHMYYHAPTNTVWFGADTGTIGRAKLPD